MRRRKSTTLLLVTGLLSGMGMIAQSQTPGGAVVVRQGGSSGGGGYSSGGERGSVVQVISDPGVQVELDLTDEQQERITGIVSRVRAQEADFFEEVRRGFEERREARQAEQEQAVKKQAEARQRLASATQEILRQLTPVQQNQLAMFCRQAAANEPAFLAGLGVTQGGPTAGGRGGTGGGGGFAGGGGFPGRGLVVGGSTSGSSGFSGGGSSGGGGSVTVSGGGGSSGGTSMTTYRTESVSGPAGQASRSEYASRGGPEGTVTRSEYSSGGGPGGVVRVISYPQVQDRLRLTSQQREAIGTRTAEVSQMEAELFAVPSRVAIPNRELIEQRRGKEQAMRAAVAQAGEEIRQCLAEKQRKRLREICLQVQGAEALLKPDVIQTLGLTSVQVGRLRAFNQETERQIMGIVRRASGPSSASLGGQPSMAEQIAALRRQREEQMIVGVLTPAQQARLRELQGEPFAGTARLGFSGGSAGGTGGSSFSGGR